MNIGCVFDFDRRFHRSIFGLRIHQLLYCGMMKKLLLIFCLAVAFQFAKSQSYEFKTPAFTTTGYSMSWLRELEDVTIEPNRIVFHLRFQQKYNRFTVQFPSTMVLSIPAIYKTFPISQVEGASIGDNAFKSDKNYHVSLVFNVNWKDLVEASDNKLFVLDIRAMQIASGPDYLTGDAGYSDNTKWRVDGIYLPVSLEQQLVLVTGSALTQAVKKGEFETTPQYTARTSPDSLKAMLMYTMTNYANVINRPLLNKLLKNTPIASYDADREMFTITYSGINVQPVQIKLPVAQAKAFKEKLTTQRISTTNVSLITSKSGNFFVSEITFYDFDAKQYLRFPNEVKPPADDSDEATINRIMSELTKKHPNGKMLKI